MNSPIPINEGYLFAKIGRLQVEVEILRVENAKLKSELQDSVPEPETDENE